MRKIKIRTLLLSALIILTALGGLGYFFNFYINTVMEEKAHNVTVEKTRTQAALLSGMMTDEYAYLSSIVGEYIPEGKQIENWLTEIINFERDFRIRNRYSVYSMNKVGTLSNMAVIKPEMVQMFRDNHIILTERINMISAISENGYEVYYSFRFGEDCLIFVGNLKSLLDRVAQNDGGYYFLITNFGNIVAETNAPSMESETLFYNLIRYENSENTNEALKQGIQSRAGGSKTITFGGQAQTFFYENVLNEVTPTDYTLIYIKSETYAKEELRQIQTLTVVVFSAILAVFLLTVLFIFYLINHRTYELENARFSYAGAKAFVLSINRRGKIRWCNRAMKAKVKALASYHNILELSGHNENVMELIKRAQPFTISLRTPDEMDLCIRFVAFRKKGGYQLIGTDVTDETLDLERARQLALFNTLTELPNKASLADDIASLIKMRTTGKNALLMFDIVNFRNINKIFGRVVGDNVLKRVASIVRDSLNRNQKLYNLEADNFAILLSSLENNSMAVDAARSVMKAFEKPLTISSNLLSVKVKFGIYNFEESEQVKANFSQTAIQNAQLALKKAKESRQIEYATYDISIGQVMTREMVMETDLKIALEKKEFEMYYQPQYNVSLGRIVGLEAMLRWNNYKYANESPEKYIRMAEQNGTIIEIGHFVIEETFRTAKALEAENLRISLNISPVQMLQSGFVRDIEECAKKYQVNVKNIAFEITETFLIDAFTEIVDKLKLLKDLGFSIHLDDFGTGYSSMLYLKELPIDTIKVDKEFVKTIVYDQYSRAIVSKVISLAKSLDLNVIVEGVETEEQNQIVTKSGCNIIQGFLISRAVPESEVREVLKKYNRLRK